MLTSTEVLAKWLGKRVDYDKASWYQCVDWVKQYCLESYNIKLWSFGGSAFTGWENKSNTFPPNTWKRILNTSTAVPLNGAVVFFAPTKKNPYGHVAIVAQGSTQQHLNIVEQNGGNGNWDGLGDNAIRERTVRYTAYAWLGKCLWWFLPR